jgi:hypothetical protein
MVYSESIQQEDNMEKVIALRLLTGEELMGIRLPQTANNIGLLDKKFRIKKPASILVSPGQRPGSPPSIGLAPFMPYFVFEGDVVEFREDHVLFVGKPDPRLEEGYRKANNMLIGTVGANGLVIP